MPPGFHAFVCNKPTWRRVFEFQAKRRKVLGILHFFSFLSTWRPFLFQGETIPKGVCLGNVISLPLIFFESWQIRPYMIDMCWLVHPAFLQAIWTHLKPRPELQFRFNSKIVRLHRYCTVNVYQLSFCNKFSNSVEKKSCVKMLQVVLQVIGSFFPITHAILSDLLASKNHLRFGQLCEEWAWHQGTQASGERGLKLLECRYLITTDCMYIKVHSVKKNQSSLVVQKHLLWLRFGIINSSIGRVFLAQLIHHYHFSIIHGFAIEQYFVILQYCIILLQKETLCGRQLS